MIKIKENKGITLIALIITIIVLLILVIVVLNAVKADGIIDYAKKAKKDYNDAQDKENTTLGNYLIQLENANKETLQNKDNSEDKYKNYQIKDLSQIDFGALPTYSQDMHYTQYFMNAEKEIDAFLIYYYKSTSNYSIYYIKDYKQWAKGGENYLDVSIYNKINDTWHHEGKNNNITYLANGYPEIMQNVKTITLSEATQEIDADLSNVIDVPENIFNMFIEEIED